MSLHDFEENECILTTQRHCPCIEFHPTGEERYGFHASQLLHYRLETEETTGHPPHKLTLGFGTADVILTGWRLDRVTAHVRDGGNLLAVEPNSSVLCRPHSIQGPYRQHYRRSSRERVMVRI